MFIFSSTDRKSLYLLSNASSHFFIDTFALSISFMYFSCATITSLFLSKTLTSISCFNKFVVFCIFPFKSDKADFIFSFIRFVCSLNDSPCSLATSEYSFTALCIIFSNNALVFDISSDNCFTTEFILSIITAVFSSNEFPCSFAKTEYS